jgi:hypothetical protein
MAWLWAGGETGDWGSVECGEGGGARIGRFHGFVAWEEEHIESGGNGFRYGDEMRRTMCPLFT